MKALNLFIIVVAVFGMYINVLNILDFIESPAEFNKYLVGLNVLAFIVYYKLIQKSYKEMM